MNFFRPFSKCKFRNSKGMKGTFSVTKMLIASPFFSEVLSLATEGRKNCRMKEIRAAS